MAGVFMRAGLTLVVGVLKGWDPLLNIVLDESVEYMKGTSDYAVNSPLIRSCY